MSNYSPLTQEMLFADFSTTYADTAQLPAKLDKPSTVGAIGTGVARIGERIDTQTEYLAQVSRLATSSPNLSVNGVSPDVSSFALPFGIIPIDSIAATTTVTLSTGSPVTAPYLIYPGLIVATASGVQFVVIPSTLSGYIGDSYVIQPGQSSVSALVKCLTPGEIGNVQAGTITEFISTTTSGPIISLASCTNPSNVINGADGETDAEFIQRFTNEVSSGRVGTGLAILSAVDSVQIGLTYQLGDAIDPNGTTHAAHFTVVVDVLGTSGGPGTTLLNEISAAIDGTTGPSGKSYPPVRSAGTTRDIVAPTEVPINVTGSLKLATGAVSATVIASATASMTSYLNNFPLSSGVSSATIVPYSEVIAQLLAVEGVTYPSSVTISAGGGSMGYIDLSVGFASRAVAGTMTFTTT